MPEIVVINLNHVTVDGEAVGSIFDLAWNRPQIDGIQGLALAALQAWIDQRDSGHAAELAAATQAGIAAVAAKEAECEARHAEHCDSLTCDHNAASESMQQVVADQQSQINSLKEQVESLGGTELGQRLAREARVRAAQEEVAAAQAKLAAIGAAE